MRILGVDPGLNITGYGCVELIDGRDEPRLVEGGCLRLKSGRPMPERLRQLFEELSEVIDEFRPHRIVVEQLFSHYKHARTGILMGHARGVVLLAAQQREIMLDELTPTEVKKSVVGHGHASKEDMQYAVMAQCGLPAPPSPSDVADAIAIALCAGRRYAGALA